MQNYYCANCGISASATAKFCRQCGAKLAAQSNGLPQLEPKPEPQLESKIESKPEAQLETKLESKPSTQSVALETHAVVTFPAVTEALAPHASNGKKRRALSVPRSTLPPVKSSTGLWVKIPQTFNQLRVRWRELTIKDNAPSPIATRHDGAAQALARASGLTTSRRFSSALRVTGIAVTVLLVGTAYLALRDQSRFASSADHSALNLIAPDEKSRQFVTLGEQYHAQGSYEAAIENFKQAITLLPGNTRAYASLAQSYQALGRVDEALQAYTQLLQLDEKNLEARFQIAQIYRERGDWRAALPEYQRLIALAPNSLQAFDALNAIEAYNRERVVNYAPLRAQSHVFSPTQPVTWLPSIGGGPQLNLSPPEPAVGTLGRAPLFVPSNNADDAVSARAIADGHIDVGTKLSGNRRYAAAIQEFQAALNLTPENNDIYYHLASAYRSSGQMVLAHEAYKKCVSSHYAGVCVGAVKETEKLARKEIQRKEDEARKAEKAEASKTPKEMMRALK